MNDLIPKNKFDIDFIKRLRGSDINKIWPIVPALLEWLQDANWPVAEFIIEYFSPYVNDIKKDIITILRSEDEMWKYWVMLCLIFNFPGHLDNDILTAVRHLRDNSTNLEKEAGVDELAEEILEKFE